MRGAALLLAGVMIAGLPARAAAQAEQIELGTWAHFDTWLDAIEGHTPGMRDAAVNAMLRLKASEVESVFPYMVFAFRSVFNDLNVRARPFDALLQPYGARRLAPANAAHLKLRVDRIIAMGVSRFLKRAAMLHADIAFTSPDAHLSRAAGLGHLVADGRNIRDEGRPWHWMLGRSFLHLVPEPEADPDVRLWYQAVAHYLIGIRNFTEAAPHLERAVQIFPADAEIQFARGLLHEGQGSPELQAAVAEQIARLPPRDRAGYRPPLRPAADENASALDAFTRALEADVTHVEARIRFGRALLLDGKPERAAPELRAALAETRHATLRYFGFLLLARAEQEQGRLDEARAAYEAAAAVFPDAQSPRLGLSQLGLQAGQREAAAALFAFLSAPADGDDPWWSYFTDHVTGRSVWRQRLWAQFLETTR